MERFGIGIYRIGISTTIGLVAVTILYIIVILTRWALVSEQDPNIWEYVEIIKDKNLIILLLLFAFLIGEFLSQLGELLLSYLFVIRDNSIEKETVYTKYDPEASNNSYSTRELVRVLRHDIPFSHVSQLSYSLSRSLTGLTLLSIILLLYLLLLIFYYVFCKNEECSCYIFLLYISIPPITFIFLFIGFSFITFLHKKLKNIVSKIEEHSIIFALVLYYYLLIPFLLMVMIFFRSNNNLSIIDSLSYFIVFCLICWIGSLYPILISIFYALRSKNYLISLLIIIIALLFTSLTSFVEFTLISSLNSTSLLEQCLQIFPKFKVSNINIKVLSSIYSFFTFLHYLTALSFFAGLYARSYANKINKDIIENERHIN